MRFVRWMGAFGKPSSLEDAISFEVQLSTCNGRQVATEALYKNASIINHALVGLGVDENKSTFIKGFLNDCYTIIKREGILFPTREQNNSFKNKDLFLKALNNKNYKNNHTEVIFDNVEYSCLVIDITNAKNNGFSEKRIKALKNRVKAIAKTHNLAIVCI